MGVTDERKQRIFDFLKQKYIERGCYNFYFKSKHISRKIGLDIRTVGKILTMLYREGKLDIWNRLDGCHVYTFVTLFKTKTESGV